MGSRARYNEYFAANCGVYFRSIGWVERADELEEQISGIGMSCNLGSLIEKYGEDNGRFLYDQMMGYTRSYSKLTFLKTGLEVDDTFRRRARAEAQGKGWIFEEADGSLALFRRLVAGDWENDFLQVPPHHQVVATYDDAIVAAIAY